MIYTYLKGKMLGNIPAPWSIVLGELPKTLMEFVRSDPYLPWYNLSRIDRFVSFKSHSRPRSQNYEDWLRSKRLNGSIVPPTYINLHMPEK